MKDLNEIKILLLKEFSEDIVRTAYPTSLLNPIIYAKSEEDLVERLFEVNGDYDDSDEIAQDIIDHYKIRINI